MQVGEEPLIWAPGFASKLAASEGAGTVEPRHFLAGVCIACESKIRRYWPTAGGPDDFLATGCGLRAGRSSYWRQLYDALRSKSFSPLEFLAELQRAYEWAVELARARRLRLVPGRPILIPEDILLLFLRRFPNGLGARVLESGLDPDLLAAAVCRGGRSQR